MRLHASALRATGLWLARVRPTPLRALSCCAVMKVAVSCGWSREVIGYVPVSNIWLEARKLGSDVYQVPEDEIKVVGVECEGQLVQVSETASTQTLEELAEKQAVWLVSPRDGSFNLVQQMSMILARVSVLEQAWDIGKAKIMELEQTTEIGKAKTRELEQARDIGKAKVRVLQQARETWEARFERLEQKLLYPLCIRELCLQAVVKVSTAASRDGHGARRPLDAAPSWAVTWLSKQDESAGLLTQDLNNMFCTEEGSWRGVANRAARSDITPEEQATAILAKTDEQERASLTRIFVFVHGKQPTAV